MAGPKLRGVLLCEDEEHERFFRRLLSKWFGRGKLYVNRVPNRQGAGDAFVVSRYVREVRMARRKRGENYALVVVVDGDRVRLQERLRQLDRQLAAARLPERGQDEMIVICVPTRNIETWELWLCGRREVDEEHDYKRQFRDAERRGECSVKGAVVAWFQGLSSEEAKIEGEVLPSLAAGRVEIQRLGGRAPGAGGRTRRPPASTAGSS